jgi:hypothetical protein
MDLGNPEATVSNTAFIAKISSHLLGKDGPSMGAVGRLRELLGGLLVKHA